MCNGNEILELLAANVTPERLELVETHLRRFPDPDNESELYPPNAAMLQRLRDGERTNVDLQFFRHELIESVLMGRGLLDADAHAQTLVFQGITIEAGRNAEFYHFDVIQQFRAHFNEADRERSTVIAEETIIP